MDEVIYKAANRARVALTHGGKTLVVIDGNKMAHYSDEHGLAPLLTLLETDALPPRGAVIGDRVVGRASAFLAICAGARAVYALTMADEAIDLLGGRGVLALWGETVPYIVERDLESRFKLDILLKDVENPAEALEIIRDYTKNT
ncbi:MAG: DUF1893 domain-containing protein [Synergistaceae bacterium]|jgi:iron complex outermembrane receptor protein|nr:DUF1893 domain-containing protein [Synergistaceae bacterium]